MDEWVLKIAREYTRAQEDLTPWFAYARDVFLLSMKMPKIRIFGTPAPDHYSSVDHLAEDIVNDNIMVWEGGEFTPNHPLRLVWPSSAFSDIPGFMLSRVVHDYYVHYKRNYSFDSRDELWGALDVSRELFSAEAQDALFTDDVAIACYYMVFGKFPKIQKPVIVKADWKGLGRYLYK